MGEASVGKRKVFHVLVSIDEAIERLEKKGALRTLGVEEVELENSLGRVLAEDIYAPIDYPPFDRSEVDGYAVSLKSVEGVDELHPKKLKVVGRVVIGEAPSIAVTENVAVLIDTGAMIPRGADGIIMEEYTERVSSDEIIVYRSIAPGENIAFAGSDIAMGELVLMRGTRLGYKEIGTLAALGIKRVKVFKKPRVAVLSIGNELQPPGTALELGKIYDVNGYMITSLLRSRGFDAHYYGILPDNEEAVYNAVLELIKSHDVVVTSGGTSAGLEDVTYKVFERVGEIVVHGLRVKPGKPTVIAVTQNGKILFGLPGFPFSALSIATALLIKVLTKLEGEEVRYGTVKAISTFKVRKDIGRTWFVPVILSKIGERTYAILVPSASGSVGVLLKIDGIAVLSEEKDYVEEGEVINVIKVWDRSSSLTIVGSHDVLLPSILSRIGIANDASISFVGSFKGLELVKKGYVDISPIHLLDPETGEYNVPFIQRDETLRSRVALIRGYRRRLVLAFKRGNPKGISGIEDILRNDVRFVNRNRGSGTRMYIDKLLKDLALKLGKNFNELVKSINGYWYEVPTHTGVAAAIAQGRADTGVCTEYAAILYGLDYIPLTWEYYDFAINLQSLEKEQVKRFIDGLKSGEVKEFINSFRGYEAPPDIGSKICC